MLTVVPDCCGLVSFLFVALVSGWVCMVLYDCVRLVILFALGVALCNLVILLICWVLICVVSDGFACFATALVSGLVGLGGLRFDFDLVAWGVPVVCVAVGLVGVVCFGPLVFCVISFCLRWYYADVVVYCSRLS